QLGEESEVLPRRQLWVEVQLVREQPDACSQGPAKPSRVVLSIANLTGAGGHERGHHPDERRLAGAVGAEEADDLAAARRERDARHSAAASEMSWNTVHPNLVQMHVHAP